jgi:hypothetical protein
MLKEMIGLVTVTLFEAMLFFRDETTIMFSLDGTNSMVGDHNSLWSRLQEANPDIILVKCVCHRKILCCKI